MSLVLFLFLVLFVGLVGIGWLLGQVLVQQGRFLLRLEAVETRQASQSPAHRAGGEQRAGLSVGTPASTSSLSSPPRLASNLPRLSDRGSSGMRIEVTDTFASEPTAEAPAAEAPSETLATEAEGRIELTIGMACSNDYDGVYFTLQALRLYQDLSQTELLVIDNYGCPHTQRLVEGTPGARYIRATEVVGTAAPRDLLFQEARGDAVLCCDCHVLLAPGVIARLKQFYREHPACLDLLQGPMLYEDGRPMATHMDPVWRYYMWGKWASDPRGQDEDGEPFEIPMHGLGVFSCRKEAWLGFHPLFRGYGGEEGYLHEKFRQAGRRCLCLPWLRWMHRFNKPGRVMSLPLVEDKLRNYLLGHAELGLALPPLLRHFAEHLPRERVLAIAEQALGKQYAGLSLLFEEEVCVQDIQETLAEAGQPADSTRGDRATQLSVPDHAALPGRLSGGRQRPLVSVVLVVYNGERYLQAALSSVLEQTLKPIEIIVVNDGSTDNTEQVITALASDPRVRPVHQNHLGIVRAKHTGIAQAQAKYIAIQDADDLSLPTRLEKQYRFLEQFPECGLVASFVDEMNEAGAVEVLDEAKRQRRQLLSRSNAHQLRRILFQTNYLVHGSVMMRKSACEAVGNYREGLSFAEDYDLWLRVAERYALGMLPEVLYVYRVHADSISKRNVQVQRVQARIVRELASERRQTGTDIRQQAGAAAFFVKYGAELQAAERADAARESSQLLLSRRE